MKSHRIAAEPRRSGISIPLCNYLAVGEYRPAEQVSAGALDGWEAVFANADQWRLDSALVHNVLAKNLAPAIPAVTLPDGRMTITAALERRLATHRERNRALGLRLKELVGALNAHDIVPVLIKGSRSIWLGRPEWRSLRDLDLLVPGRDAEKAQAIAIAAGFVPEGGPERFGTWHHRPNLYRPDLPGWIEIHNRGGVPRAEQFISTGELVAAGREVPSPDGRVRLLPPHLHVLHGMVHHHVGHDAGKRGEIDLKGLYEFAAGVAALDAKQLCALAERAARHPRLLAIMDLWTAGAADIFGLTVRAPLSVSEDAAAWWQAVRHRTDSDRPAASNRTARAEELAAASAFGRLRRAPYGKNALARLAWRAAIALSFVQRPALLPAWF